MTDRPTQKQVEAQFRRILGPDPEHRARIAKVNADAEWRVRCWNCKEYSMTKLPATLPCPHCGANLNKRGD
jgi:Zn finger protein HypA/HybF involved in hydrogenase expression